MKKLRRGRPARNVSGQRFGHLTALYPTTERRSNCVVWMRLCDCGTHTTRAVNLLRSDVDSSCGCVPTTPPDQEKRRLVAALRDEGLTYKAIGERLSITRQRAHQLAKAQAA